jgi:hypothetical protein
MGGQRTFVSPPPSSEKLGGDLLCGVANLIIGASATDFIHASNGKHKVVIMEKVDVLGETYTREEAAKPIKISSPGWIIIG